MTLFKAIVLDVWKERQASNLALEASLNQRVEDLEQMKQKLIDAFIYRKEIDPETYRQQLDKLNQDLLLAKAEVRDAELEGYDIKSVVSDRVP